MLSLLSVTTVDFHETLYLATSLVDMYSAATAASV